MDSVNFSYKSIASPEIDLIEQSIKRVENFLAASNKRPVWQPAWTEACEAKNLIEHLQQQKTHLEHIAEIEKKEYDM